MNDDNEIFINMTYHERLKDPKWNEKKKRILDRDNHTCQYCGCHDNLHVHHKTYRYHPDGTPVNPWDYLDDNFITLCKTCHNKTHHGQTRDVYVADPNAAWITPKTILCPACGKPLSTVYGDVEDWQENVDYEWLLFEATPEEVENYSPKRIYDPLDVSRHPTPGEKSKPPLYCEHCNLSFPDYMDVVHYAWWKGKPEYPENRINII